MKYYVCHIRGAEFSALEAHGFITFYPYCDDYAFLPALPQHDRLLRKEASLQILFLRSDGKPTTINEKELASFSVATLSGIQPGASIEVLEGTYAQMNGYIESICGDVYHCKIESYKKMYEIDLKRSQFAVKEDDANALCS